MNTKHARQIRHGVLMAQKHVADRRQLGPYWTEELNGLLDIHRREFQAFITTGLERRAYQIARMKLLGMSWTYETGRAA